MFPGLRFLSCTNWRSVEAIEPWQSARASATPLKAIPAP